MRLFLLIAALACPLASHAQQRDFTGEFYAARKLEKTSPEAAITGMTRSFEAAIAAGNSDYATAAGVSAAHLIYRQGRIVETGRFCGRVIEALDPLPASDPEGNGDAIRRLQLFGYLERGLLAEGKIGAACQTNRAAAETLRGRKVTASADGAAITVREVAALPANLRSLGWRLIEREAELLDYTGRTLQARALLDSAAEILTPRWNETLPQIEHFYAFKLLASRAMIYDFLGDQQAAITQQEALLHAAKDNVELLPGCLTLRLNLLRNRSQWEGPSEAFLQEAREVADSMQGEPALTSGRRLVAKMELDLKDSQEAMATLREGAINSNKLAEALDSAYANRDSLIARARTGENDLDTEYIGLLGRVRTQGNKRAEPTLYREYGDYLANRRRPAEAIPVYREALRLSRSFGWDLHLPRLLKNLLNAQLDAGDPASARATLTALESFIGTHPDMPNARRVAAEAYRASALSRLGDAEGALAALKLARTFSAGLPAYQTRWLTPELEAQISAPLASNSASAPETKAQEEAPSLRVQPLEITSIALPGESARTRVSVFNPTGKPLSGHLQVEGPGATADRTGALRFSAGQPSATLNLPCILPAGGQMAWQATITATDGIVEATVKLAWKNPGKPAGPASAWSTGWDASAKNSIVLDASSLEANPFRHVSLFHELAIPDGALHSAPLRLRSPIPLRIEYYEPSSQTLLAVDATGDGDFTGPGDLHGPPADGITAAILPTPLPVRNATVEIHLFTVNGTPLFPSKSPVTLQMETWRDGKWTSEAEDILR